MNANIQRDFQICVSVPLKLVRANVLIRLYALSISVVQSSTITLEQRLVESCCDVIVLTLRRRDADCVSLGANIG